MLLKNVCPLFRFTLRNAKGSRWDILPAYVLARIMELKQAAG
jgi:hypothetical protein